MLQLCFSSASTAGSTLWALHPLRLSGDQVQMDLSWYEMAILGRRLAVVVAVCALRSATVKTTVIAMFYMVLLLAIYLLCHEPHAERQRRG